VFLNTSIKNGSCEIPPSEPVFRRARRRRTPGDCCGRKDREDNPACAALLAPARRRRCCRQVSGFGRTCHAEASNTFLQRAERLAARTFRLPHACAVGPWQCFGAEMQSPTTGHSLDR